MLDLAEQSQALAGSSPEEIPESEGMELELAWSGTHPGLGCWEEKTAPPRPHITGEEFLREPGLAVA